MRYTSFFIVIVIVCNVTRALCTVNLPANSSVSARFLCRVTGKHASNLRRDVFTTYAFLFPRYSVFSVSALIGLYTLTFDL